jgi:hypothetical protein
MAQTTVFYNSVRDIVFEVEKGGKPAPIRIHGSGFSLAGADAKILPGVGAYGMTQIDSDVWEEIVKRYGEMDIFKNGLIKAGASEKAKAAAKEEVSSLDNGQGAAKQEEAGKKKTTRKK